MFKETLTSNAYDEIMLYLTTWTYESIFASTNLTANIETSVHRQGQDDFHNVLKNHVTVPKLLKS